MRACKVACTCVHPHRYPPCANAHSVAKSCPVGYRLLFTMRASLTVAVLLSIEASKKQRLFERRIREMDWIWRYSRVHVIVGKRQLEGWQCGTRTHAPLRPRFKRFSILASDTCMEIQRLAEHSLNKDVQELCVRLHDELWARVVSFLLT